jgi:hypothetical protein
MNNVMLLSISAMFVFLSGCATVPMATLMQDESAKNFSTLPNKGVVFIYRNEGFIGASLAFIVSVNGKTLGETAPMTYFRLNLNPGKYRIDSYSIADNSAVDLNVEAGRTYFVWQEIKLGLAGGSTRLHDMSQSEGKEGILESKLIAASISDDEVSATVSKTDDAPSVSQKLHDLQSLKKDGVTTEDEYENKKQELMKSF